MDLCQKILKSGPRKGQQCARPSVSDCLCRAHKAHNMRATAPPPEVATCAAFFKSGLRKGERCPRRATCDQFCLVHSRSQAAKTQGGAPQNSAKCRAILKSGKRKGEKCERRCFGETQRCKVHTEKTASLVSPAKNEVSEKTASPASPTKNEVPEKTATPAKKDAEHAITAPAPSVAPVNPNFKIVHKSNTLVKCPRNVEPVVNIYHNKLYACFQQNLGTYILRPYDLVFRAVDDLTVIGEWRDSHVFPLTNRTLREVKDLSRLTKDVIKYDESCYVCPTPANARIKKPICVELYSNPFFWIPDLQLLVKSMTDITAIAFVHRFELYPLNAELLNVCRINDIPTDLSYIKSDDFKQKLRWDIREPFELRTILREQHSFFNSMPRKLWRFVSHWHPKLACWYIPDLKLAFDTRSCGYDVVGHLETHQTEITPLSKEDALNCQKYGLKVDATARFQDGVCFPVYNVELTYNNRLRRRVDNYGFVYDDDDDSLVCGMMAVVETDWMNTYTTRKLTEEEMVLADNLGLTYRENALDDTKPRFTPAERNELMCLFYA